MGNQQMSVANQSAQSTAVAKYGDDQELTLLTRQLKIALPNGKDLTDAEARALIIAGKCSGLDYNAGEIYYIPGVGVMVATKVIIADAMTAARKRGVSIIIDFQPIQPDSPEGVRMKLNPADVAWACIVTDSKIRQTWFNERLQLVDMYKRMGFTANLVLDMVNTEQGAKPPTVISIAIVNGDERFGNAKAEAKFSRDDRCKKRALKKSLNLGGYASTTEARRNYGDVPVADDDAIEAEYHQVDRPAQKPEQVTAPSEAELKDAVASAIAAETQQPAAAAPAPAQTETKVVLPQADEQMAAIQRHVDNATRALAGGGYPTSKAEGMVWTLVKAKAMVMGFTSEELAKFSPGKDPHVTTLLHSVKALGAAIIERADQQAIEPEPASEQDVIEVEENQTTLI